MDQTPPMLSSCITSSRPWALKQVPRCARMSTADGPGSSSALPRKRNSAANRLNSQNEGDDHERICPPRPSGEPVCAERVSREGRPIPDRAHRSERHARGSTSQIASVRPRSHPPARRLPPLRDASHPALHRCAGSEPVAAANRPQNDRTNEPDHRYQRLVLASDGGAGDRVSPGGGAIASGSGARRSGYRGGRSRRQTLLEGTEPAFGQSVVLAGEQLTLADVMLAPQLYFL